MMVLELEGSATSERWDSALAETVAEEPAPPRTDEGSAEEHRDITLPMISKGVGDGIDVCVQQVTAQ